MKKITSLKKLSLLICLFCAVGLGFGQILTFDFDAIIAPAPTSYDSNSNDAGLTISTITRGSGLTAFSNNDRFNGRSWNQVDLTNAIATSDYMEFSITPTPGYKFNITTIVVNFQRSNTGPKTLALRNSLDSYATTIDGEKTLANVVDITEIITFNVVQTNSSVPVTYRIYGWAGETGGSGGFEGKAVDGFGDDIVVNGSVFLIGTCPSPAVTWTSTGWDNAPNINTPAIIDYDYDTSVNGSFSACSLTVGNNATLDIANNTFVEVENVLTLDALSYINVQPYGSFVQNNDASLNSIAGDILVDKVTAPMDAWYEYTYWSSPVVGAKIGVALPFSPADRRYQYNGQDFLDKYKETSNNNDGGTLGQDDIDDNNNDWQWIDGNTVMKPGIGYATTLTELGYNSVPGTSNKTFRFTFEGAFNNGEYNVPIYRNDSELNDYNWNLIGNPYPSAIDADLFLAANSGVATDVDGIDAAIFLWSQNTAPSSTANGNQAQNFSNDDYAIISMTGEIAGGDGNPPIKLASGSRVIPSGSRLFCIHGKPACACNSFF